jgi:hypothetical protein
MWTTINHFGWGQVILRDIMFNPAQMASRMAEIYRDSIVKSKEEIPLVRSFFTISVVDLSRIEEVHLQVKSMSQNLISDMDDIKIRDKKEDNLQVKWANEILPQLHDFSEAVCTCACSCEGKGKGCEPN